MRFRVWSLVALAVMLGFAACGESRGRAQTTSAVAARAGYGLHRIGSFAAPLYVAQPPGDSRRLFVVEQAGRIRVVRDGRTLRAPFLDIRSRVSAGGERGLLSVAFAPDYAKSGLFYVDYTDLNGDTHVVEYRRASADRADAGSARLVLFQRQPEANHNGGLLLFGPDRLMYVGFGDGGGGDDQHGPIGNAQNLGTWLGKILRIDPRAAGGRPYSVPRDNPFVGRRGARPEIYAWGLRNPWRFSFDRANGDMSIGDVGQDHVEEIDFRKRGRTRGVNYGWREWEGTRHENATPDVRGDVKPVLQYTHDGGNCSVTGGYVIRDRRIPTLNGRYVYADFCAGKIFTARLGAAHASASRALGLNVPGLSSFGEDSAGRIYVTSLNGPVYRLDPR